MNATLRMAIIASVAGLLFALLYTAVEIRNEDPTATHSISVWHTPLCWLLASTFFFLVLVPVRILRADRLKEQSVAFWLSVACAALLGSLWLYPMLRGLFACVRGRGC